MITVCPSCSLALSVTAADLRAGQGFVRCSRCDGMFSALPTLREAHEPEPAPLLAPTVSPAVLRPFDPTATDVTAAEAARLEFDPRRADVASVFVEPRSNLIVVEDEPADVTVVDVRTEHGAAADGGDADAHRDAGTVADTIADDIPGDPASQAGMLPPEDVPATDAAVESTSAADEPAESPTASDDALNDPPIEPFHPVEVVDVAVPAAATPDAVDATDAAATPDVPDTVDATDAAATFEPVAEPDLSAFGMDRPPPPAWHRPALLVGAVALALLLVLQALNHWRHDLATNPNFYRPLKSVYDAIGVPLVPHWNVRAYEVRQLGAVATTGGDGQLAVRMSVRNGAPIAQPAPMLRVNVQDRFGNTIATRDVAPATYLPQSLRGTGFLQPGQRLDTEVRFLDPGRAAVGFEIDACVPAPSQGLVCAGGTP